MNNQKITQLVVGASRSLKLGVPAGQGAQPANSGGKDSLHWRDGQWQAPASFLDRAKTTLSKGAGPVFADPSQQHPAQPKSARAKTTRTQALWLLASAVCLTSVAALWYANKPVTDDIAALPIASSQNASKTQTGVRTVDEPWIRPAAEPPPSTPVDTPIPPATVAIGQDASAQVPSAPTAVIPTLPAAQPPTSGQPRPTLPKQTEPRGADSKKVVPEAVVLDVDASSKSKDTGATSPVPAKQPLAEPSKAKARSGLVAVMPDGKTALFTNTSTRLPEKFGVGDKLPSGEIIKSIDASAGVVKTDAKEYRLE